MAPERILGIVGGVGPEATADYYRRLIDRWKLRRPDGSYPPLLLNSLNSRAALDAMLAGDRRPTVNLFTGSVARLAAGGAGLAIVASVMMHMAFDEVAASAPIPMLSILDALAAEARRRGFHRLGILAPRPTTEGEFFARPFERARLELVRPEPDDRAWIHEVYFSQLVRGDVRADVHDRLVAVIHGLRERGGIDAVILGGTELPLVLREPAYGGVPVLDSTGVHVEAALDWLLGEVEAPPS